MVNKLLLTGGHNSSLFQSSPESSTEVSGRISAKDATQRAESSTAVSGRVSAKDATQREVPSQGLNNSEGDSELLGFPNPERNTVTIS
jgi:hypothetical protein